MTGGSRRERFPASPEPHIWLDAFHTLRKPAPVCGAGDAGERPMVWVAVGAGNPQHHRGVATVNRALILVCVAAFILGPLPEKYAFLPAYLFGTPEMPGLMSLESGLLGLVGHVFLHADPIHIVTNMIALWIFGDAVEDALGHGRYLLFFFLCAAAGALAEGAITPEPLRPLVGASGAISGVMGAYLLLHPHARILVLLFLRIPVLLPASVLVGGDLAANVAMVVLRPQDAAVDDVAWWAHLGGFAAGMLLVVVMRRRGVPLFHPPSAYPPVPFPRVQRIVPDMFSPRGARRAAGKAVLYLALVLLLIGTL